MSKPTHHEHSTEDRPSGWTLVLALTTVFSMSAGLALGLGMDSLRSEHVESSPTTLQSDQRLDAMQKALRAERIKAARAERQVRTVEEKARAAAGVPACEVEDGSTGPTPCVWDGRTQGNGEGDVVLWWTDGSYFNLTTGTEYVAPKGEQS